jgi:hypothetical protein
VRVQDLLRGCRAVLAMIAATLLTEWFSLVTGANMPQWNWATGLQAGLLALMTVLTALAATGVHRVAALHVHHQAAGVSSAPDWLTDAVAIAEFLSRLLGPLARPALAALSWTCQHPLTSVRRHPLWSAASAAVVFGAAVGGRQAMAEGYMALAALLTIVLLSCGMFAFLIVAGAYLGLVRGAAALGGARRQALDASVLTCIGLLVVLAFRNSLWWIVGSRAAEAGIPQIYALLGLTAATVFAVVFACESARHMHQPTTRPP